MSRFVEQCKKAKSMGYIYISGVVKSVFQTTYYNVNKIDDLIKEGKWIPSAHVNFPGGAHGRFGTAHRPDKCLPKTMLYSL